ncbi:MAG: transposase family protein [Chitinophagaceae bacterium]
MQLTVNKLIQWHNDNSEEKWIERVLFIDSGTHEVAVINASAQDALPYFRSFSEIEIAVEAKTAIPLESDIFAPPRLTESELESPKFIKLKNRRDKALKIIAPLFTGDNAVRMLFTKDRALLINSRLQEIKDWPKEERVSKQIIYRYCRRRWQGGQVDNAQIPHYLNCGARRDKPRNITKKLGRKSIITWHDKVITGANMTPEWLDAILLGGKLFYEHRGKASYSRAYALTLERFFIKDKVIENGREKLILPDPNRGEIFTRRQFIYHYNLNRDPRRSLFKREGAKRFNLKHRELVGNSNVLGPGALYQIDATIADVYLISRYGGNRLIGRPVIWVVIDVFSRMIVGFCIRLEGEGWLGLQLALENTTADKVALCARYNIPITEDMWPTRYLPEHITGDRGPLISANADHFVHALNIEVSNTPPFRPDWKGIVEQIFRRMNIKAINWLPGAVKHDHERGDEDYRLSAVLDIEQLNEIIIEAILYHNNEHLIADEYELDADLIAAKIDPIPANFYRWGVEHKSGHLRERDAETIRYNLLPHGEATITEQGIKFKHPKSSSSLFYTCDQALIEGWLLRDTGKKSRKFDAVFDPRWNDEIYLNISNGQSPVTCHLKNPKSPHANRDWSEVIEYHEGKRLTKALLMSNQVQAEVNLNRRIQNVVSKGKKRVQDNKASQPPQSKAAFTKGKRDNRRAEIEIMHAEEAKELRNKHTSASTNKALKRSSKPSPELTDGNYIGVPQIPNIADLRKKRIGK